MVPHIKIKSGIPLHTHSKHRHTLGPSHTHAQKNGANSYRRTKQTLARWLKTSDLVRVPKSNERRRPALWKWVVPTTFFWFFWFPLPNPLLISTVGVAQLSCTCCVFTPGGLFSFFFQSRPRYITIPPTDCYLAFKQLDWLDQVAVSWLVSRPNSCLPGLERCVTSDERYT